MKTVNLTYTAQQMDKGYSICIGSNLLEKIATIFPLASYSSIFIITDEVVKPLFLEKLLKGLPQQTAYIALPAGEKAKDITNVGKIWEHMKQAGCDRKTLVITLGGGVIGDMGGFAASTYMRGVAVLHIPTTVLSQIDASIGGKTAIDFSGVKNLIGTFHQPVGILIDTKTLETLSKRAFIEGFGEMLKHGLIADGAYFSKITEKQPTDFSQDELAALITRSCEIKSEIISSDEIEGGKRKLLNFGHTIGHGIEAVSLETEHPLLHGEAVSIGMVAEAHLSALVGLLSEEEVKQISDALQHAGLPISVTGLAKDTIIENMQHDKKSEKGKSNFTLLEKIGKAVYNQQVSDEHIEKALSVVLL